MSNGDHRTNIGTHPIHSLDPEVAHAARVEAGNRRIDSDLADLRTLGVATTVTVTIGRNVATGHPLGDGRDRTGPMPVGRWHAFQDEVRLALHNFTLPDFQADYSGRSYWEGISEDSTTFVASGCKQLDRAYLRAYVADLAHRYGQDAIALTIGTTELVES